MRRDLFGRGGLGRLAGWLAAVLALLQAWPALTGFAAAPRALACAITCTCPPGQMDAGSCCCVKRVADQPRPPADLTAAELALWHLAWDGAEPCRPPRWRELPDPADGMLAQGACGGPEPEVTDPGLAIRLAPPPSQLALAAPPSARVPWPADSPAPRHPREVPEPVPLAPVSRS